MQVNNKVKSNFSNFSYPLVQPILKNKRLEWFSCSFGRPHSHCPLFPIFWSVWPEFYQLYWSLKETDLVFFFNFTCLYFINFQSDLIVLSYLWFNLIFFLCFLNLNLKALIWILSSLLMNTFDAQESAVCTALISFHNFQHVVYTLPFSSKHL